MGDAPAGPRDALGPALRGYLALYAGGRYFDAHEALETVWRRRPEDPRMVLLHGLIQWVVALEHHRRGNAHGARVLLARAWSRLRDPAPGEAALGLDLAPLRAAHPGIAAAFDRWDRGGPRPALAPPPLAAGGGGAPPPDPPPGAGAAL
ncbi:MAG TPA: DUF309 domain-containing protein [Miltoncostaeaceae bacterium]|nr:DUF309 domain-containing protein [Miltoncostaeaceae bacterium]